VQFESLHHFNSKNDLLPLPKVMTLLALQEMEFEGVKALGLD